MKEPKKEPVPRFAEPDPALAATDPGDPPFVAPQSESVNLPPRPPMAGAATRDFSHLDPETAARAARIVDAYQKSRSRSPEEFEADFRKPAHRDSLDVFVDALHQAKPAVHRPAPAAAPGRSRSAGPDEERPSAAPRQHSTPPDSPEAIRSSRSPVVQDLTEPDPPTYDPAAEGEGDRITLPSLRRQRKQARMRMIAGIAAVLVVALAGGGWALLHLEGDSAATAPAGAPMEPVSAPMHAPSAAAAAAPGTTAPIATAPVATAPVATGAAPSAPGTPSANAAVAPSASAQPSASVAAPAAPPSTHHAPGSTSRTRTPKPARVEPPGSELLQ
ncbi:hypothetical protein [Pendulispora albinea]|uniref:Uncharacterized protein n=1 Tax=Pendulispora albinea TaxID=2741071 RepID=A0ABZ2M2W9_9BACT